MAPEVPDVGEQINVFPMPVCNIAGGDGSAPQPCDGKGPLGRSSHLLPLKGGCSRNLFCEPPPHEVW